MSDFPILDELPANIEVKPRTYPDGATRWFIAYDGEPRSSTVYATPELAEHDAREQCLYDLARERIAQAIGPEYEYGIRVWAEPPARPGGPPIWRRTDPYTGHEAFAFAWYSHTPPPVNVYTRAQYELACTSVGLEPVPEAAFHDQTSPAANRGWLPLGEYPARVCLAADLVRYRWSGIGRE